MLQQQHVHTRHADTVTSKLQHHTTGPCPCRANTRIKVLRADVASGEAAAQVVAAMAANAGLEQLSLGGPVPDHLLNIIAQRTGRNAAAAGGGGGRGFLSAAGETLAEQGLR